MNISDLIDVPDSIDTLAEWHHAEWSALNPGESIQKRIERMHAYLSGQALPKLFVGIVNEQVLGSAGIVAHDMATNMALTPWLASVYVEKQYRHQGLGSALVTHAMAYARSTGFSDLYLFTPDQADFYQRLGWYVISTERYHGQVVTVMQVKLRTINLTPGKEHCAA